MLFATVTPFLSLKIEHTRSRAAAFVNKLYYIIIFKYIYMKPLSTPTHTLEKPVPLVWVGVIDGYG